MNPFRADRFWRLPEWVHTLVYRLTGQVVVRTGWGFDDEFSFGRTYRWANYRRDVLAPARERFDDALAGAVDQFNDSGKANR